MKKAQKIRLIKPDFISFAYRHFDGFGFLFAIKSVISDKLAYALILPPLASLILISQSVVLGKRKRKVIDEFTARRHGIIRTFFIVTVMFFLAAVKVVCSTYFENKIIIFINIVANI